MSRFAFLFLAALSCASLAADRSVATMKSILLIAREDLPDPNFHDTVVLVAGGTIAPLGVILNRPTKSSLSRSLGNADRLKGNDGPLFFGGPVEPEVAFFVFRASAPAEGAISVGEDVYLSSDREVLDKLLERERPLEGVRVYAGHASWGPGQLEHEIARGDWHLAPADAHTIFDAKPETMWPALLRKAMATKVRWEAR